MSQLKQNNMPDIKKTIILNAPIEKVWSKISTSSGIAAWFMPNDFKPEVGNKFYLQSPFGPSPCEVLEINPPHNLSFLWDESGWKVSFQLKEIGDKTEFTMIHSGWMSPDEIIPKSGNTTSNIHDTMSNGWEAIINQRLLKVVES